MAIGKKLIRGLLIRARLKDKYSLEEEDVDKCEKGKKLRGKDKNRLKKEIPKYSVGQNLDESCTKISEYWPTNRESGKME